MTTLGSRIELADFFAETADPALLESADRGQTELLDYRQLYELWERQQWLTQELDFTRDREDWHGFPEEERFQRMYGLSSFFIGEQKVTDELGPMMRAAPTEDMQVFLVHPDRRRGAARALLRPLLRRGGGARVGHARRAAPGDQQRT